MKFINRIPCVNGVKNGLKMLKMSMNPIDTIEDKNE